MNMFKPKDCLSELENIPCILKWQGNCIPERPFFSVVIPTYKRPDILKQAVESVLNQVDVNFDYEIIIVDNEETDECTGAEVLIRQLNVSNLSYYRNSQNIGGAGNWNRCIMLAKSQWVIMCHDDDMVKPNCLKTMYEIVDKHKSDKKPLGYIRSSAESLYEGNVVKEIKKRERVKFRKSPDTIIKFYNFDVIVTGGATWAGAPTCGSLINKLAFYEVGGFNKDLTPCFDCYLVYFMLRKGYTVAKTYYSLGVYRWGENDTYKKTTLLGLIAAYNVFLKKIESDYFFVRLFSNENYADCVNYYIAKGREGNVIIYPEEVNMIRPCGYSKLKLKILYFIRKSYRYTKELFAN